MYTSIGLFVCFILINMWLTTKNNSAGQDFKTMITWLTKNTEKLKTTNEFADEVATIEHQYIPTITLWKLQSETTTFLLLVITQITLYIGMIAVLNYGGSYILNVVLALLQSGVFVRSYITYQNYYRAKGICYGIAAHVQAKQALEEEEDDH